MNLLVIGMGNMGSAMVDALLKRPQPLFERIFLMDHSSEKCEPFRGEPGVQIFSSLDDVPMENDLFILLAVKPQGIDEVLVSLRDRMASDEVLISIAAGVSMERIQAQSGHGKIVRVMPNTPAQIGQGACGWIASQHVATEQKPFIQIFLETFGLALEVSSEDQIDAVTALSGSGPAYVFYFVEALIEGGVGLGLSGEQAYRLALQTVLGGAMLAQKNAGDLLGLQQLRTQVTSKGGTTERAIASLESDQFKTIVVNAMQAAYDRARGLNKP